MDIRKMHIARKIKFTKNSSQGSFIGGILITGNFIVKDIHRRKNYLQEALINHREN